jgi:hypothetical protein
LGSDTTSGIPSKAGTNVAEHHSNANTLTQFGTAVGFPAHYAEAAAHEISQCCSWARAGLEKTTWSHGETIFEGGYPNRKTLNPIVKPESSSSLDRVHAPNQEVRSYPKRQQI